MQGREVLDLVPDTFWVLYWVPDHVLGWRVVLYLIKWKL